MTVGDSEFSLCTFYRGQEVPTSFSIRNTYYLVVFVLFLCRFLFLLLCLLIVVFNLVFAFGDF